MHVSGSIGPFAANIPWRSSEHPSCQEAEMLYRGTCWRLTTVLCRERLLSMVDPQKA